MLVGSTADELRIVVHLAAPLGHERTPKNYLQEFTMGSDAPDIEWKLPEGSHPVIEVDIPADTNLDLQLGKAQLEVGGIVGNKHISVGKGSARLYAREDNAESGEIVVDVAMGSFADLRPGDRESHRAPLHEEIPDKGSATAHLEVAMGKAEIAAQ